MKNWNAAINNWKANKWGAKDVAVNPEHNDPARKLLYWYESILESYKCSPSEAINAMGISDEDKNILKKEMKSKKKG